MVATLIRNVDVSPSASIASRADAIVKTKALLPQIRARAAQAEENRRISDDTISELLDSGLFQLLTPKALGGSEIGFAALVETTVELASACGSTGWVYGVLAGHSWMLHLFPEQTQREVFTDPHALTATVFRLGGKVTVEDGGYRITGGEGRFCSGIDFASWVIVGGSVSLPDGTAESRFFLVPKSEIIVIDDWFTAGMKATGSRSIQIKDSFVPVHRSLSLAEMTSGKAPGASFNTGSLYQMSFSDVTPFSIVGAPIGMARGAAASQTDKMSKSLAKIAPEDIADHNFDLVQLAGAVSDIDVAYATVLREAEMIDKARSSSDISALDRARLRKNWAYGVQTSRDAANALFAGAGGSSIYSNSDLQRFWRDVNSASQHQAFGWNALMVDYGRALVGLDAVGYKLKVR
jgi:3-hydroxy-9,10-secoandrosta-1,3,5(10)-triene-9,17-dione monooxygenase